jgi:hypothetical protein
MKLEKKLYRINSLWTNFYLLYRINRAYGSIFPLLYQNYKSPPYFTKIDKQIQLSIIKPTAVYSKKINSPGARHQMVSNQEQVSPGTIT